MTEQEQGQQQPMKLQEYHDYEEWARENPEENRKIVTEVRTTLGPGASAMAIENEVRRRHGVRTLEEMEADGLVYRQGEAWLLTEQGQGYVERTGKVLGS